MRHPVGIFFFFFFVLLILNRKFILTPHFVKKKNERLTAIVCKMKNPHNLSNAFWPFKLDIRLKNINELLMCMVTEQMFRTDNGHIFLFCFVC